MLPRLFELAHFFQHAAEIELRQAALQIQSNGAAVALRGLLEISLLVVERSAINQGVGALRILPQRVFVRVNRLRPRLTIRAVGFVVQRQREPLIRAALGNHLDFFIQLARLEIHYELAGHRFEPRAFALDDDVLAIGKNAQLGERRLHLRKLLAQRRQSAPQPRGGNTLLDQLLDGAQRDEVAKIVEARALLVSRGNQLEAVPVVQLFWRQTQDALDRS